MKKVIIIEDNHKDFECIKSILDSQFNCPQQYTKNDFETDIPYNFINKLRKSLLVTCSTQEEYTEQKKMAQELQVELKGYCSKKDDEPVYLIDYLLDGSGMKNDINGIRFKEKFMKEIYPNKIIPVLFITSADYSPKLDVEEYVKKINDVTICNCQTKPNTNEWHRVKDDIINFIKNSQSKPRIEKKDKNIEEIYEGN